MLKWIKCFIFLIFSVLSFCVISLQAQNCEQATAQIDLDINNVKARLLVGGDLWWDGDDGKYIIPKPAEGESEISALFMGALWLGGYDPGGILKVAAQTYGTANGNTDYWPGPLTEIGTTTPNDCTNFDRFWSTNSSRYYCSYC